MRDREQAEPSGPDHGNRSGGRFILGLAGLAATTYFALALAGDLRVHLAPFLAAHAALVLLMLVAWRLVRRDHRNLTTALVAALVFRLVATAGEPALSDDLHRYVWDGRVQLQGIHPYAHAPDDPALAGLRDEGWRRINHPEIKTIYPPLAQLVFALLAALGAGPVGFKLAMGLADFGVLLLLDRLLRRMSLPRDRLVLYGWNPLAVLETAGSGHVEPVGILLVVAAVLALLGRRERWSAVALAGAAHVKLLPLILAPTHLRRAGWVATGVWVVVLALLWLPYAVTGPPVGEGLYSYAERWEYNASAFALVQGALERCDSAAHLKPLVATLQARFGDGPPWDRLYRYVWPREVAKLVMGLALAGWLLYLLRSRPRDPVDELLLVIGAVLLLSPTVHPWYVLWLLPFAVARLSPGWLVFAACVPLAYQVQGGDVPWAVRVVEYGPALTVMLAGTWIARSRARRLLASSVCTD